MHKCKCNEKNICLHTQTQEMPLVSDEGLQGL